MICICGKVVDFIPMAAERSYFILQQHVSHIFDPPPQNNISINVESHIYFVAGGFIGTARSTVLSKFH